MNLVSIPDCNVSSIGNSRDGVKISGEIIGGSVVGYAAGVAGHVDACPRSLGDCQPIHPHRRDRIALGEHGAGVLTQHARSVRKLQVERVVT